MSIKEERRLNIIQKINNLNYKGDEIEQNIYDYSCNFCSKRNEKITFKSNIFNEIYTNKARQIIMNLNKNSYVNNHQLDKLIGQKKIVESNICNYNYNNIFPSKWKKYNKDVEILNKEMGDLDQEVQTTEQFQCKKCKKRLCVYTSVQTRSSDEPMTLFITCVNCNHHFKE
jgi:DNA-directed RNA polymerase subunit M/transcription elongation factor TFIIS